MYLRLTISEKSGLKEYLHWRSYNMGFEKKNKNDVTVFARTKIFEIEQISEHPGNIPRRMALEPCLCDLPSLRKAAEREIITRRVLIF